MEVLAAWPQAGNAAPARVVCRTALLCGLVVAVGACSSEQVYNAAQGWRRNECYKLGDLDQRERCLKEADRPYDAYRAATGREGRP